MSCQDILPRFTNTKKKTNKQTNKQTIDNEQEHIAKTHWQDYLKAVRVTKIER